MNVTVVIPYFEEDLSPVLRKLSMCLDGYIDNVNFSVVCVCNGGKPYYQTEEFLFDLLLISEQEHPNSPYSARNRGIEVVDSDWYIFLDATCIPKEDWLLKVIEFSIHHVYAANVSFKPRLGSKTLGDLYDSIINIDNQKTVSKSGAAKTACLAISKETLNKYGKFEEGIRSGGDVIWTQNFTRSGGHLEFCPEWKVTKYSRNTFELLKKQYRVSKAWPNVWRREGCYFKNFLKRVVFCFLPPNPTALFNTAERRGLRLRGHDRFNLVVFGVLLRMVSAAGVLYGTIKK